MWTRKILLASTTWCALQRNVILVKALLPSSPHCTVNDSLAVQQPQSSQGDSKHCLALAHSSAVLSADAGSTLPAHIACNIHALLQAMAMHKLMQQCIEHTCAPSRSLSSS